MPFKSKSQMRFMYATKPKLAAKWEKETSNEKDLPEKKKQKSPRTSMGKKGE